MDCCVSTGCSWQMSVLMYHSADSQPVTDELQVILDVLQLPHTSQSECFISAAGFIYKLSVLTCKALHRGQPCYLADLIDSYEPSRCL